MTSKTQSLGDRIEAQFAELIASLREAEGALCALAAKDPDNYGAANADVTEALGHVYNGKAAGTRAGLALPDVTVRFGGK